MKCPVPASQAGLLEVVLGAHGARDLHIAAHVIVLENLLDLEVNAEAPWMRTRGLTIRSRKLLSASTAAPMRRRRLAADA